MVPTAFFSSFFANEVREGKLEDNVAASVGWVESIVK